MVDISYGSYSLGASQSGYRTVNGSGKNRLSDTFKTKVVGNAVYIEQTSAEKGVDWDEIEKMTGKYALKNGRLISHHGLASGGEFRFYYAAESTEERPVLVAKGVDEYGMYFEEKIDVKQIDPYNTSTLELKALSLCNPGEDKTLSNPYNYMQGQEKDLRERFNFVAGAQTLIRAWKRIGYATQAIQWNEELNFLLSYTENTAKEDGAENDYRVNEDLYESISKEYKRNMELYCNAAKERLVASMTKRCSEDFLDIL